MRPLSRRPSPRGAAITEMALVLPIFVTIFLFGMFFTEVVRAKLKMLEAARFAGFEMTSYVLDDYGANGEAPSLRSPAPRHDAAFREARDRTLAETNSRFADLDSVATRNPGGFVAGYRAVATAMTNEAVDMPGGTFSTTPRHAYQGQYIGSLLSRLDGTASQAHRLFGFDQRGHITVDLEMRLDNRILPRRFLDDSKGFFSVDQWGGSNLQSMRLRSRFSLIASGWQLPDGADAEMEKDESQNGRQAGLHRGKSIHGMWLQVNRMTHLGLVQQSTLLPGVQQIIAGLELFVPSPFTSTFVTAHNYGLTDADLRSCARGRGDRNPSHPALDGMNNLDEASELDVPYRKCYDTAPFRDVAGYDSASDQSLYVKQYLARGDHFMGCPNAQADDPSTEASRKNLNGDINTQVRPCGSAP